MQRSPSGSSSKRVSALSSYGKACSIISARSRAWHSSRWQRNTAFLPDHRHPRAAFTILRSPLYRERTGRSFKGTILYGVCCELVQGQVQGLSRLRRKLHYRARDGLRFPKSGLKSLGDGLRSIVSPAIACASPNKFLVRYCSSAIKTDCRARLRRNSLKQAQRIIDEGGIAAVLLDVPLNDGQSFSLASAATDAGSVRLRDYPTRAQFFLPRFRVPRYWRKDAACE